MKYNLIKRDEPRAASASWEESPIDELLKNKAKEVLPLPSGIGQNLLSIFASFVGIIFCWFVILFSIYVIFQIFCKLLSLP
jgi:hypothetical protein